MENKAVNSAEILDIVEDYVINRGFGLCSAFDRAFRCLISDEYAAEIACKNLKELYLYKHKPAVNHSAYWFPNNNEGDAERLKIIDLIRQEIYGENN